MGISYEAGSTIKGKECWDGYKNMDKVGFSRLEVEDLLRTRVLCTSVIMATKCQWEISHLRYEVCQR
eukprot:NODE_4227_length_327_cov_41.679856_g4145_i0.p2 GENE.NODE_4227_length_327_cov_41.679856_g4145_i0~~NODE_4227_length_327_cov_41.679856_g4145_i0.p2  ORF type:complete len:77 (+),score=21.69 NODE_4227_length_327_cov_41.679856_g4145_i0:31-231(+)